uniref:Secreted protein n=1 Tax=Heterorhabditis bacteriophora TaxID=37862 RepID=A0A1I7WM66_HETBA
MKALFRKICSYLFLTTGPGCLKYFVPVSSRCVQVKFFYEDALTSSANRYLKFYSLKFNLEYRKCSDKNLISIARFY